MFGFVRAVAAFGVAIGMVLIVWTMCRAASVSADGARYLELARQAWQSGIWAGMDWYSGPVYPVAASWLYGLTGRLELAGRITSSLFGLGALVGLGLLAHRLFGRTVSAVSVALLAVHTSFVRHSAMAETDIAYMCWSIWSIWLTWELSRSVGCRRAMLSVLVGLSLGLAYLTRPEAVALAGLLGLWYLLGWPMRVDRDAQAIAGDSCDGTAVVGQSVASVGCSPVELPLNRRLLWSLVVGVVFVVTAFPYLLRLRAELGRWSLSGKERAFAMKYAADRQNTAQIVRAGVFDSLLRRPVQLIEWLPHHVHYGLPVFGKTLHPVILFLVAVGLMWRRSVGASDSYRLLLWVSVPVLLFFGLTYPRPRYFMQSLPAWTILAAVGSVELGRRIATWRARWSGGDSARYTRLWRRAFRISVATPIVLVAASAAWSGRRPIEQSLAGERAVGERIKDIAGPGCRVLSFTVPAFYAEAERVPLWGPMQGIVRCYGFVEPLSYEQFVDYVKMHKVEIVNLDHELRGDCPEFLDRVRPADFQLLDVVHDGRSRCHIYRYVGPR